MKIISGSNTKYLDNALRSEFVTDFISLENGTYMFLRTQNKVIH